MSFRDTPTHRFPDGKLVTSGRPRFTWARLSATGKVHHIETVIIRWNFMGGTLAKPDVTFVATCGPQRRWVGVVENPDPVTICARCDSKRSHRATPTVEVASRP